MKKIVKIGTREYTMQSSAYTQFSYKNETGRSLLKDLESTIDLKNEIDKGSIKLSILDNMSEMLLKMSYVMAQEADKNQVTSFEDFVKSIDSLYDDMSWITDVIELACTPISRQLQGNK